MICIMAIPADHPYPVLYRCFCAFAGLILLWSDYTINLVGLYPAIARTAGAVHHCCTPGHLRRSALVTVQVIALLLID